MADPSASAPPSLGEARLWIGHGVDDLAGGRVGEVRGLYADRENGEPTWLVAKLGRSGLLTRARSGPLVAIPLRNCAAGGSRVWIAHGRDAIRSAPVVDPSRPLLREHELAICAHFGIGESVGRAADVADRAGGAVTSVPGQF